MVRTIKPINKEIKEDDNKSSKHSEGMGKSKQRFHPPKNSTKIIIEETEKHNVILFLFFIQKFN